MTSISQATIVFKAMKKLFFFTLTLLLLSLTSCQKEGSNALNDDPTDQRTLFNTVVTVKDGLGNHAVVKISAAHQEIIDNLSDKDFDLVTTTNLPKPEGNFSTSESNKWAEEEYDIEKTIFVDVIEHKLNSDIVGFFVQPKASPTSVNGSSTVPRWFYDYAYGADGVRGAQLTCSSKTGSVSLLIKLSKKNTASSWFWDRIADGELTTVGQSWAACSSTQYWKYRLGTEVKGSGSITYSQFWLTSCP